MLEDKINQSYKFENRKPIRFSKLRNYLVGIPIILSSFLPVTYNKALAQEKPSATQNGDVNGDQHIDISDPVYLLNHLFLGGPSPVPIKRRIGLPVTGQIKCYDNEKEIPCPKSGEPFYGQDGNYQAGIPRDFEVVKPNLEDDSTWYTIDHATGLMWQYKGVERNWEGALQYCENLELGGYDNWRLPNIRELHSIVDYGRMPAINNDVFESYTGSTDGYISSTTYISSIEGVWAIYFEKGQIGPQGKFGFVRAVRNIQSFQNGDVNGDGETDVSDPIYLLFHLFLGRPAPVPIKKRTGLPVTGQTKCYDNEKEIPCPKSGEPFYGQDGNYQAGIPRDFEVVKPNLKDDSTWYTIDHATGLMWQYKDNIVIRNWESALEYCENLELEGLNDWKLPNIRELHSIVDYGRSYPALDTNVFNPTSLTYEGRDNWYIWVSTYDYAIALDQGYVFRECCGNFTRAVRPIQPDKLER